MAELFVVRHAQASFGAADYDVLSDLGHEQSIALGRALRAQGIAPTVWVRGEMRRHRETLEGIWQGMGITDGEALIHTGLNEFDFKSLLDARFAKGGGPENMHTDRKTHFKILRDTVLAWQHDEIENPPETWAEFSGRVEAARQMLVSHGKASVLAVSSGGAISQLIATTLRAPAATQIELQLQMRNCAVHKFIHSSSGAFFLHGYNETPHIGAETQHLLTYS